MTNGPHYAGRATPEVLAYVTRCFLCDRPAGYVGLFEPHEPWNFSPDPPTAGKVRRFAYGLCDRCVADLPSAMLRVEEKIRAEHLGAKSKESRR
jgi:hypothetical protein